MVTSTTVAEVSGEVWVTTRSEKPTIRVTRVATTLHTPGRRRRGVATEAPKRVHELVSHRLTTPTATSPHVAQKPTLPRVARMLREPLP